MMSLRILLFCAFNTLCVKTSIVDENSKEQRFIYSFQKSAFDERIYKNVLDEELCHKQLSFLLNDPLKYQFIDASSKLPSGILTGNINNFGDYYQCLGIQHQARDMHIQGKYCTIVVPLQQEPIDWTPFAGWDRILRELPVIFDVSEKRKENTTRELASNTIWLKQLVGIDWSINNRTAVDVMALAQQYLQAQFMANILAGFSEAQLHSGAFDALAQMTPGAMLATCVPQACTARQTLDFVRQRVAPFLNLTFHEYYCRLPGDKHFAPADYFAVILFSIIAILIIMSTTYDLMCEFYYKRDISHDNTLYRSFSVYTNTWRLLNFKPSPDNLECVDGIRAISMMWVVVSHTYWFSVFNVHNTNDILEWFLRFSTVWLSGATVSVDTFFMLSGMFVVYTTLNKLTKDIFLRNLHMFYLHRLLRMFPLLATTVLLEASFFHHVADGPLWSTLSHRTQNCREWWWSALLHVQNYVNPVEICLPQTWFLSADTQLLLISPLVLGYLWGTPRIALTALGAAMLLALVFSTIVSFFYQFSASLVNIERLTQLFDFQKKYYYNTLSRSPPYFVGMIFGYMLHTWQNKTITISKMKVTLLWLLSLAMMAFCIFCIYPITQPEHTAQMFDNFINAYMRTIWAVALGWQIFACVKGYGGPINWFLSLRLWKLPARVSFAVYLVHLSVIAIAEGTWVKTHYFSNFETFYRFIANLTITFAASLVLCVSIDAPCSTLLKLLFEGMKKKSKKPKPEPGCIVIDTDDTRFMKTSF